MGSRLKRVKKKYFYEIQKGVCILCDKYMIYSQATFEHIIPVSKEGTNSLFNIGLAHKKCNNDKGDSIKEPLFRPKFNPRSWVRFRQQHLNEEEKIHMPVETV